VAVEEVVDDGEADEVDELDSRLDVLEAVAVVEGAEEVDDETDEVELVSDIKVEVMEDEVVLLVPEMAVLKAAAGGDGSGGELTVAGATELPASVDKAIVRSVDGDDGRGAMAAAGGLFMACGIGKEPVPQRHWHSQAPLAFVPVAPTNCPGAPMPGATLFR
jgi:hypothetical protein